MFLLLSQTQIPTKLRAVVQNNSRERKKNKGQNFDLHLAGAHPEHTAREGHELLAMTGNQAGSEILGICSLHHPLHSQVLPSRDDTPWALLEWQPTSLNLQQPVEIKPTWNRTQPLPLLKTMDQSTGATKFIQNISNSYSTSIFSFKISKAPKRVFKKRCRPLGY